MKHRIWCSIAFIVVCFSLHGQKQVIELAFTAMDSLTHAPLDSIKLTNLSQGSDTVLYWPDTILVLDYFLATPEEVKQSNRFLINQNYPNPFRESTKLSLQLPEWGDVQFILTDATGHQIFNFKHTLSEGLHQFRIYPGAGNMFFLTALWQSRISTIKLLRSGGSLSPLSSLEYLGEISSQGFTQKTRGTQDLTFGLGDELLCIGYAGDLESAIIIQPTEDETITFQFGFDFPCLGVPSVEYEGQVYETVQVFSQCWLRENLNIGIMLPGGLDMEDNGLLEKYCYANNSDNCDLYGGLYQWNEMMQYVLTSGTQGICPPGWHIPTDEEWKILQGVADSYYPVGSPHWNTLGLSGTDVGINIKASHSWNNPGIDYLGFTALPAGVYKDGIFLGKGVQTIFWTSTEYILNYSLFKALISYFDNVLYNFDYKGQAFSVRCVKDQ